jgi:hypothetical protein
MQDVKFTERYRAEVVRQHIKFYRARFRKTRRARRCMERFTKLSCSDLGFKVMLNEVFRNG